MASTKTDGKVIKFGPFEVTKQVFLTTPHSFGLVNLKPLIPGHILVCPLAPHLRLTDLSPAETTDLFATVQLAQRLLARTYFPDPDPSNGSFTVALQDGADAGQTVPHVHVHVIPRMKGDLGDAPPDQVYVDMASEKGNVGGALWDGERPTTGGAMPRIEDADRRARTVEEMYEEVEKYRAVLNDMGIE
ncbi:Bis(5'-nucleosyl)-tetraphosphatase [Cladobotryum mycophilum]|uniref:Bis(5'-adenosyl)-triphosphatase n=1 Tax=Cladobotryum mycophilum TaxID=491253 RepID=A0ABR0T2H3_9HYPO